MIILNLVREDDSYIKNGGYVLDNLSLNAVNQSLISSRCGKVCYHALVMRGGKYIRASIKGG